MEVRIATIPSKNLAGKRLRMSFSENRVAELWRSFMPERKLIKNNLTTDLFSVQVFDSDVDFRDFNGDTTFERWAAVEVADFSEVPQSMERYTLSGGLYAVFNYVGSSADFQKPFEYIFSTWLPRSEFELDKREHFELLGEKYKNNDPASEEEIWIPVKKKQGE
jgi:AraC family transcriptional regulator